MIEYGVSQAESETVGQFEYRINQAESATVRAGSSKVQIWGQTLMTSPD